MFNAAPNPAPGPTQPPTDFKTAFCKRFGCAPEAFERKLFWQCIPPRRRVLARLVNLLSPDYFHRDYDFIRRIGQASRLPEVAAQAGAIPSDCWLTRGFLRRSFQLRISSRRLMQVAKLTLL
jgi:hypothetical protein